ncbi:MAG: orotidine-5'-phosphate decarboxylase [Saprospiraceae bacterium]|nr:orotidine-5'-phosphate decarboxylase [Saprospiraceae bacterium]
MTRQQLFEQIQQKKSYLCVGLDTDLSKIPPHLLAFDDPIFEFNKQIIDATRDICVAYKPNTAFYESQGVKGWIALEKTVDYIGNQHFTIADAKRGDIGNTSKMYAQAFFDTLNFDAVTVAPYMGQDSVKPFLEFKDKWTILLALTSNKGSEDFQFIRDMFKIVLQTAQSWGTPDNLMFVIGATQAERFKEIRKLVPHNFFLVPGIGAQGGDLRQVSEYGMNDHCGLLVNSSREIIYAGHGEDFAEKAREAALKVQQTMGQILEKKGLV